MKIALATILAPTFNSRVPKTGLMAEHETRELKALSESLKTQGQLQPIEVETTETPGAHLLVFGDRRRRAAALAGWTEIDAVVRPPSSANERAFRNSVENMKRENLTSYEKARVCSSLRKVGLNDKEIGSSLSIANTTVSNLAVTYERMPEPILKEWSEGNSIATDRFLRDLATEKNYPTATDIMQAWDVRVAEVANAAVTGEGKGTGGRGKGKGEGSGTAGFPVSQKRIAHLVDSLTEDKSPKLKANMLAFAKNLVAFIIQAQDQPPDGVALLPVVLKAVPLTEEQKAAIKATKEAEKVAAKAKTSAEKLAAKAKEAADKANAAQAALAGVK